MVTTLKQWGNSYAIRITKNELKQMHAKPGTSIEKIFTDVGLWCRPLSKGQKRTPTLEEMIASIPQNGGHKLLKKGPPVGEEVW